MRFKSMLFEQLPNGKIPIVHIEKFEDVLIFAKEINKIGLSWCDGKSYLNEKELNQNYYRYGCDFCFSPTTGEFSGLRYYLSHPKKYQIFEYKWCFDKPKFVEV